MPKHLESSTELIKEAYGYDPTTFSDDITDLNRKIKEGNRREIVALITTAQHMGIISAEYARELMPT